MKCLLILLSLFFLSCSHKESWKYSAIENSDPQYDMAKLSYPADSTYKGILLELIRQNQSIEGYLCIHSFEFPSIKDSPNQSEITFNVNGKITSFVVDRLQGGQRLHLSQKSLETLLDLLQKHPAINIQIGHFFQTFNSIHFDNYYRKLWKFPPHLTSKKLITFELY